MSVVDASVLANALVYADDRGRGVRGALERDAEWAAPEHWQIEVFSKATRDRNMRSCRTS